MNFDNTNICFSNMDLKRNIELPTKLTPELAELIGIILGDECIYLKENTINKNKYEIIIYGHSIEDIDFHTKIVKNLVYNLFNLQVSIKKIERKNAIKIRIGSKAITNFFVKKVGLIYRGFDIHLARSLAGTTRCI